MRVLQVQSMSRTRGGADDVMDQEAALLRSGGHDVEQLRYEAVGEHAGPRQALDVVWNRAAGRQVSEHVRRSRPDVVHVHSPYPLLSPVVFRAASQAGAATVTTVHSYRLACVVGTCLRDGQICQDCVGRTLKLPGVRHRCYHDSRAASGAMALSLATHRIAGTFDRHVHRYLALTDFARDLLVRDGYPPDRVAVAPNSVPDPGERPARSGAFRYAAFLGRFVPEKGVDTLLGAWEGLDVPLKIAGDGPGRPAVEAAAARNPGIEYVGWLDSDAETALLSGADLLVFPSTWFEGQPLVLLRAMAAGLAVLSSDIENIEETAVAQGAGLSFAAGNPAALSAAVSRLVADPDARSRFGTAGRAAYLRRHSPAAALGDLVRHYEAALHTRDSGRTPR